MLTNRSQSHDICRVEDDEAQEGEVDEVATSEEVLRAVLRVAELSYPADIQLTSEAILQILMIARRR